MCDELNKAHRRTGKSRYMDTMRLLHSYLNRPYDPIYGRPWVIDELEKIQEDMFKQLTEKVIASQTSKGHFIIIGTPPCKKL